ncbi:MAG: 50S ribosomal protein L11 [Candidatus Bathyarchaeota archaeon]|nr:50S ribosomal protein L11 [Candidatus Bathyarchaeota archaeon]
MMKKIKATLKLQIPAGKANPAPPIGPALGQHGLNIGDFCQKFNEATKDKGDNIIPVEITIFEDRSFELQFKTPPVASLLKKAAGIDKGSSEASRKKVGKVTKGQIEEIAKIKQKDLNTNDIEKAKKIIEGTAKSMGVTIE